ncbi:MAG: hypothetical protein HY560_07970 [Gemmatimonadetes bacterium]|nr:hypothetical protein [Gemmatimonadota bacterium]
MLATASLLSTCVLPPEPSSQSRIEFTVPRDTPLVAIAGELVPAVRVLADGKEVPRSQIRFQSDSPTVATIDSVTGRVTARKRGVAGLRVRFLSSASGNQPPESTFAVRVVIARMRLARQADSLGSVNETVLFRPGYLDAKGNALSAADSSAIKPRFQLLSPGRAVSVDTTGVVVSKANGTDTLQATVDTTSISMIVTVRQRAVRIAFATQPSSAAAGVAIAPAVRVAIQDAAGSAIAGDTTEITLDSAQNAQGKAALFGAQIGTQKRKAVDGVATFTGISIIKAGQRFTLQASGGSFTPVVSDSFDITPGAPDKLGFLQPPKATRIGQTFPQPVVVAVQDLFGNTITGAGNAVTIGPDSILTGTRTPR